MKSADFVPLENIQNVRQCSELEQEWKLQQKEWLLKESFLQQSLTELQAKYCSVQDKLVVAEAARAEAQVQFSTSSVLV